MAKQFYVKYYNIDGGQFKGENMSGPYTMATIGRDRECNITSNSKYVSRKHGILMFKHKTFGEHLVFRDDSGNGTQIIQLKSGRAKINLIKGDEKEVNPGDWIMISPDGESGILLKVSYN